MSLVPVYVSGMLLGDRGELLGAVTWSQEELISIAKLSIAARNAGRATRIVFACPDLQPVDVTLANPVEMKRGDFFDVHRMVHGLRGRRQLK